MKLAQLTPLNIEVQAANDYTPMLEKEFGGLLLNLPVQAYVRGVGQKLLRHSARADFNHAFKVLASKDVPNAFALGNGNVYVTVAMLQMLDDEAELAEILGHEIAHVEHRHMAHKMDLAFGFQGLMAIADSFIKKEEKKQ